MMKAQGFVDELMRNTKLLSLGLRIDPSPEVVTPETFAPAQMVYDLKNQHAHAEETPADGKWLSKTRNCSTETRCEIAHWVIVHAAGAEVNRPQFSPIAFPGRLVSLAAPHHSPIRMIRREPDSRSLLQRDVRDILGTMKRVSQNMNVSFHDPRMVETRGDGGKDYMQAFEKAKHAANGGGNFQMALFV